MKPLLSIANISAHLTKNLHFSSCNRNVAPLEVVNPSNNSHRYKNLYPWKTIAEFSKYLLSCIVYDKYGVIALNKPYGVKITKNQTDIITKNTRFASSLAAQEDCRYSVEEALPYLSNQLKIPNLSILKSTERYSSGLVLMSTDEKICNKVRKSINIAKNMKRPHLVHWAVTRDYPVESMKVEKVGLKLVDVECIEKKEPVLVTHFSHNDVKRKRIKTFLVECRTLSVDREISTSLLEIAVSATTSYFLRVYASSRAASILGDQFYGSRMRTVLGVKVNINPHNMIAYDVQPLPKLMCQKLHLSMGVEGHLLVPTMLHLQTIILPKFQKDQDLFISALPPPHFQWTCAQLNLLPTLS